MDYSFLHRLVLIAARHSGLAFFDRYRLIELEVQGNAYVFNVGYSAKKVKTFSYWPLD